MFWLGRSFFHLNKNIGMDEARLKTVSLSALWPRAIKSTPSFTEDLQSHCFVFDTNVLLDLLYWEDPLVASFLEALEKKTIFALFDEETLFEFALVLDREKFSLTKEKKEAIFIRALSWAILVSAPVSPAPSRCKDTDDQKFLDLAFGYKVSLITKDKLLLKAGKKLKKYGVIVRLP